MNPKIDDNETLPQATDRLFFKDQVWTSAHQLGIHLEYFGAFWGFVAIRKSMNICCNRHGVTQVRKNRPNKGIRKTNNSLKCNCPWAIKFKLFNDPTSQTSDNDNEHRPIIITKVNSAHGNGCEPGIKQYTWCKTKAGQYSNATLLVLQHLVS